jgi:hypothetical protein
MLRSEPEGFATGKLVQAMKALVLLRQALIAAVTVAVMALPALPSLASTQRLALVIGNSAYADGLLKNPINDARAMAGTLRELGFEVRVLENADRMAMQRAVVEFGRKLNSDTVGLFLFRRPRYAGAWRQLSDPREGRNRQRR